MSIINCDLMNQAEICRVPKYIQFQYRNEQQMHSTVEIENLIDKVVSYKIKSNRPQIYLVKPMQGEIYNHEKVKIVFTRKQLSKNDFEMYFKNLNQSEQKFLVQISCLTKDSIGREKSEIQSALIVVNFRLMDSSSMKASQSIRSKKEQQLKQLIKVRNQKVRNLLEQKTQLGSLEEDYKKLKEKKSNLNGRILEMKDIIIIIIVCFFVGFAI